MRQPSTGSRPCRQRRPWGSWSVRRSCAGASSGITRSSNRRLGSATTRGEAGAASIITPAYASPPTGSWSPSGAAFPPQNRRSPNGKRLPSPSVTDPAVPPIRPERHVPDSIATLRLRLARALTQTQQQCPCCRHHFVTQ